MQWYYSKNGAQHGPVDDTELRRLALSGEITKEDLLWNASMGDQWQPASSFNFLFFHPVDLQPPAIPSETELTVAPADQEPISNRNLMGRARASLNGRWGVAVLVILFYCIVIFLPLDFGGASTASHSGADQTVQIFPVLHPLGILWQVFQFVIIGPLSVGFCFFFLGVARRAEISFADLFKGFRIFWKAIGLYFLTTLLSLFWMFLAFLPVTAAITGAMIWTRMQHLNHESVTITAIVLLVLLVVVLMGILGVVGSAVKILGYAMSYFILADHPSTGPLSAIRKSKAMMQGRKWKFVYLQLRFLGWCLLGLLTFGIGFLWVFPYIQTANAHFYLDVKDRAE